MIVVLTGASRGIGRHIAHALLREHHTVCMVNRTLTKDTAPGYALDPRLEMLTEWQANVGDREAVRAAIQGIVDRWGRIDAVINNAGEKVFEDFLRIPPERFEQVVRTNLCGPFHVCQEVVPVMLEQRSGRIINISSRAGLEYYGRGTAYCASKAGLVGFSQSLADALRGTGVTVNVLCPPTILTPEYRAQISDAEARRLVPVETVIQVVLDLLRPDCRVTGRIFPFYSPRSFVKSAVLGIGKYLQWLPQIRYRTW